MEHYSQLHLKAPATEPEHVVRKAEFDRIADRYSTTEEVNTGKTWIDGKPIHRSYFYFGTVPSASSWQYKNHGIADIEQIVEYRCFSSDSTAPHAGKPTEMFSVPGGNISTAWNTMSQIPDLTRVALNVGSNTLRRHYWFWIEYTKTTDPIPREFDS
ncbi:MAG TPA: hypothetical protein DEB39_14200 [Planctomycetaceae bacterium]|nr:hypothetical protein [Planctomycetaceae bacterium]